MNLIFSRYIQKEGDRYWECSQRTPFLVQNTVSQKLHINKPNTNVVQLSNQNPYFYRFRCHHPLITQLSKTLVLTVLDQVTIFNRGQIRQGWNFCATALIEFECETLIALYRLSRFFLKNKKNKSYIFTISVWYIQFCIKRPLYKTLIRCSWLILRTRN